MRDWREEIRKSLAGLQLDPSRESEIVEELNQDLCDRYEDLLASGISPENADQQLTAEVSSGKLAAELKKISMPKALANHFSMEEGNFLTGLWKDLRYGARV